MAFIHPQLRVAFCMLLWLLGLYAAEAQWPTCSASVSALWGRFPTCPTPPLAVFPSTQMKTDLGERLYLTQCAMCHGQQGEGGRGPVLAKPELLHAPDDDALRAVIRFGIAGTGMPGTRLIEAENHELAAYVRKLGRVAPTVLPGNAQRGEQLYRGKGGCVACHMLSGYGGAFGTDLTGIGASRSPQHLRESLLDPAADLPRGFASISVTTRVGRKLKGIRINEDGFSIQFRDAAGSLHSFWKNDLREFRKELKQSPMPSYRNKLTPSEIDDLVAYLASLQEAK